MNFSGYFILNYFLFFIFKDRSFSSPERNVMNQLRIGLIGTYGRISRIDLVYYHFTSLTHAPLARVAMSLGYIRFRIPFLLMALTYLFQFGILV